jgi:tyrosyl-tRNA synthetase
MSGVKKYKDFFKIDESISIQGFTIVPDGAAIPTNGVVKIGFDPTGKDLHLGHLLVLKMVKKLKENGMSVSVILGTMTAQLGDPSGRDATRPMLSSSDTKSNAEAILSQLYRILGKDITIHYNHEWFEKMTLPEILQILSKYTVDYLMSRDAFQKRKEAGNTIGMHELIVPLLQGLDSVQLNAAVEVGGTDQLFNFLLSRDVQEKMGQKPEICLMSPIINGTDGRKMSKSFNNCIFINDTPKDVFGKAMSISDAVMYEWYPIFFETHEKKHPMQMKKDLASKVTDEIWGEGTGEKEKQAFESQFQSKQLPTDIKDVKATDLVEFIVSLKKISKSEARRLVMAGAVNTVDGTGVTTKIGPDYQIKPGDIIKVGKRDYGKVI